MGCISTVCSSNYLSQENLFLLLLQRVSTTHLCPLGNILPSYWIFYIYIFIFFKKKQKTLCTVKPEKLIRQGKLKYAFRLKQSLSFFSIFQYLKQQFRVLKLIPISSLHMCDIRKKSVREEMQTTLVRDIILLRLFSTQCAKI